MTSLTEENYLKSIYHLSVEQEVGQVPTNAIAENLGVNAASVTDMFKKLRKKKLVEYEKSRGVTLTPSGKKMALQVIRKHRLWETFLVEKLMFSWDEVHDIAEQLEHVQSELLVERLDKLLEHPKSDPHGDPIPDRNGKMPATHSILLAQGKSGSRYKLFGVNNHSETFLKYLNKIGLVIGETFHVKEVEEFDGSMKIQLSNKSEVTLSREASESLMVAG
jgi:DtxR family Mn-dependent transcriptional regulator